METRRENGVGQLLPAALRPFIQSIVLPSAVSSSELRYQVLPPEGFVFGFQLSGSISVENERDLTPLFWCGITGLQTQMKTFVSHPATKTVLVHFTPCGAKAFLKEPLHEYTGQHVALEHLVSGSFLNRFENEVKEAGSQERLHHVICQFLIERFREVDHVPDPRLTAAVKALQQSQGNIRIKAISEQIGLSARQLERKFLTEIGLSPKQYALQVRFKALLNKLKSEKLSHLAIDQGFYDESHLIKSFVAMTGYSPAEFCRFFTMK